jgi:hypothetical protein
MLGTAAAILMLAAPSRAQQTSPTVPTSAASNASSTTGAKEWTTADDHRQMLQQLGITALRPGPSGNEQAPNHANYDEAKANPYPSLPPLLTLKNGQRVTSPRLWARRRA